MLMPVHRCEHQYFAFTSHLYWTRLNPPSGIGILDPGRYISVLLFRHRLPTLRPISLVIGSPTAFSTCSTLQTKHSYRAFMTLLSGHTFTSSSPYLQETHYEDHFTFFVTCSTLIEARLAATRAHRKMRQNNSFIIIFMVYIPRINFKSGINPSVLAFFPTDGKFSGTHKLMLARTRIFGDKFSGNHPSGMKQWRKVLPARHEHLFKETIQMHDLYRAIPGLKQIHDDDHLNKTARKHYREQMKIVKDAKKAAKEAKKKK